MAQALSLMIYSTKTSLRIRSITIQASVLITHCSEYIVSVVLDSRSEDRVYVATSNSWLYLFNLTNGDQINKWNLGLGSLQHVCLCSDQMLEPSESEVVYVVSADTKFEHPSVTRISLSAGTVGARTELYRSRSHIVAVHVTDAGRVVCLITGRNILVLNGESRHVAPRVYQMAHPLTCMDTYLPSSSIETGNKSAAQRSGDIVVGDITGAIYILHNVIKPSKIRTVYTPTKHHWHRMAVCSVKWALDGTSPRRLSH